VIVQRWAAFTGQEAKLADTGAAFDAVRSERLGHEECA
jgi:hypothetical protein